MRNIILGIQMILRDKLLKRRIGPTDSTPLLISDRRPHLLSQRMQTLNTLKSQRVRLISL